MVSLYGPGRMSGRVRLKFWVTTPWPITDRDMIRRVEAGGTGNAEEGGDGSRGSARSRFPSRECLVRVQGAMGSWTLVRVEAERTRVIYRMCLESDGRLPDLLISTRAVEPPLATLARLRIFARVAAGISEVKE